MSIYRLVSDYGFGDVSWLERDLTPEQAIAEYNRVSGRNATSIPQCEDMIYRVEEDDPNEEQPDTFLDS